MCARSCVSGYLRCLISGSAIDLINGLAKRGLGVQTQLSLDNLQAAQDTLPELIDSKFKAELDALRTQIAALKKEFEGAVDEAKSLPVLFHKNPALLAAGAAKAAAGGGLEFSRTPEGLFDARFAKQIFGNPQNEQIKLLGQIGENTANIGAGGLPVV